MLTTTHIFVYFYIYTCSLCMHIIFIYILHIVFLIDEHVHISLPTDAGLLEEQDFGFHT